MPYKKILAGAKKEFEYCKNDSELFKKIVNYPFRFKLELTNLSLGIIEIVLVNKKEATADRIVITDNELTEWAKRVSAIHLAKLKIPTDYEDNIIAKSIKSGKPISTTDWQYLLVPALPPTEARFSQTDSGISLSVVFPFSTRNKGALIFHYYQDNIEKNQQVFMESYTNLVNKVLRKKHL
jgi:hypothetical protein